MNEVAGEMNTVIPDLRERVGLGLFDNPTRGE